jgi:hypothetical protein
MALACNRVTLRDADKSLKGRAIRSQLAVQV